MSDLTVKQLREELGLSVDDFADLIGVKRSQCEQWLYGQRNPSKATKKLMEVFLWMHKNNCLSDFTKNKHIV